MAHAFYTIGHGRRPIAEFVDLLREVEVTLLADVPHPAALARQSAI